MIDHYHVEVSYDPLRMKYMDGADTVDEEAGLLTFDGTGSSDEIKFWLTFQVISGGTAEVKVVTASATTANGADMTVTTLGTAALQISGEDTAAAIEASQEAAASESKVQVAEEQAENIPAVTENTEIPITETDPANSELLTENQPTETKSGIGHVIGIICGVSVVICLGCVLIFFAIRRKKQKQEKQEDVEVLDFNETDSSEEQEVIVEYIPNGGTGSIITKYYSIDCKILAENCEFERENYYFCEWSTNADGTGNTYKPGEEIAGNSGKPIALYAQWTDQLELDNVELGEFINTSEGVQINWKSVLNAKTYQVYRRKTDEKWRAIARNIQTTSYLDTTAEEGLTYFYTVRALHGKVISPSYAFASGDNQRGRNQMAMLQALIKKVCSIEFLENYNEVMDELTDMYRTNIPDELLKDLVFNQLMDGTEWTVDIYSVTGSGGSEKTYSAPNSAAYVMIPNDNDVAQAKSLIEAVLNETP